MCPLYIQNGLHMKGAVGSDGGGTSLECCDTKDSWEGVGEV